MFMTLPKTLNVGGEEREINSDFRPCFGIMQVFENNDLTSAEKLVAMLGILYVKDIPIEHFEEAIDKALWFLNGGESQGDLKESSYGRLYSWEQDSKYIISAVDRTLSISCRSVDYLHWWDFTSALMECKDCMFSTLIHQRKLKKQGKQSKYDKEWWSENMEIAELKNNIVLTPEEQAALERFNNLLG
ncbi:Gp15 family bacteriophage protein [Anaerovorax sp. IOR16]|uniref:Gp15 family bacteriophage protein n=1 Tax=Anaerovorax sp. IOR16 TaxID=2773458 RepID=UPI0019D04384|nr:Gp15 family bacteriophage protein [Anaerovorax sp. IOR16]